LNNLKGKAVLTEAISLNPIDLKLLKVDVAPLVPKLRKNKTAHTDYIRHTQEEAATLREILERVNLVSSASGSLSQDNTKHNRIRRTQKKAKKNKIEDHLRTVKSSLNKESVLDSKATSSVINSVTNVNSDLKCASCNGTIATPTIVPPREPILIVNSTDKPVVTLVFQIVLWYLNSGCSKHMTGDRSQLVNFVQKFLGTVKFRNDHVAKIMGYGDYQIGNVTISRDETPDFIIKFLKMIQLRLKVPVCRIRTDNGTEFVNHTLRDYYEAVGISHETSVARSPQQNGVIERRNRTLIEAACTMLIYAQALLFLWAEAMETACFTQNRSI
nr:retrotransposon protein, putative, Ty1-copia subclass [Tanacetum cinerariifolium]